MTTDELVRELRRLVEDGRSDSEYDPIRETLQSASNRLVSLQQAITDIRVSAEAGAWWSVLSILRALESSDGE